MNGPPQLAQSLTDIQALENKPSRAGSKNLPMTVARARAGTFLTHNVDLVPGRADADTPARQNTVRGGSNGNAPPHLYTITMADIVSSTPVCIWTKMSYSACS